MAGPAPGTVLSPRGHGTEPVEGPAPLGLSPAPGTLAGPAGLRAHRSPEGPGQFHPAGLLPGGVGRQAYVLEGQPGGGDRGDGSRA